MVVNFLNSSELLQNAKRTQLYRNLVLQLQKDFGLANIPIDLIPTSGLDEIEPSALKSILHEKVYYLIMERFSEYLNILYIIDVPEVEVKKIKVTDAVEVAEQVSFLILKREWQKVWLRAQHN